MANPSGSVYLVQGKKSNSGSDRVYDHNANKDNHPDGMVEKNWIVVGGAKLIGVPEKLYFADSNDLLIIAYKQDGMEVLAWWNHAKKEGTSVNILHLIFNAYALMTMALIGIFIFYYRGKGNPFSDANIYGISAAALGLAYVFSFFNWKKKSEAQTKVNEQKNKRTNL